MSTETEKEIKLSDTEQVIARMLRENTGKHFLDSGEAYGRNWQRNQGIPDSAWKASGEATVDFRYGIEVTLNVFHFLANCLDHASYMERVFKLFCAIRQLNDYPGIQAFLEYLGEQGIDVAGLYGEDKPMDVNTYNGEDLLSQVIQYTYASLQGTLSLKSLAMLVKETADWTKAERKDIVAEWKAIVADAKDGNGAIDSDGLSLSSSYVFLQIHGGADVRGGYTDVRVFTASDMDGTDILMNAHGTIYDTSLQSPSRHSDGIVGYWTTDDGCHWYQEGSCGRDYRNLESFDIWKLSEGYDGEDGIERAANEAYMIATEQGHTSAVKMIEGCIACAETDDARNLAILQKATLTKELLPFIPVTAKGTGFSPYTLGKLAASR